MESENASIFDHIQATQWDPIIEILEEFRQCNHPDKINLTVGAYRDEDLKPVVFKCVQDAENKIFSEGFSREYLSPTGDEEFNKLTQTTIFPADHDVFKKNNILTIQSISGSGCLRLGGEFINKFISKNIYIPHLTWPNHTPIFELSLLNVIEYKYYSQVTNLIDIDGMLSDLENAIDGSVVLLHVCGHNPTGVDATRDEWKLIANIMKKKNLFPFFDMAYLGFISGDIIEDSYPVFLFYDMGFEMFIAQSFSKSMGLYGERAGPLHIVVTPDAVDNLLNVKSQFGEIAKGIYLVPVGHGSRIIKTVLSDQTMRQDWLDELKVVVNRLNSVREKLYAALINNKVPGTWEHIKEQHGMFSYTGLTLVQCEALIKNHKIFLVKTGRISLAGLNDKNINIVALAMKDVVTNY